MTYPKATADQINFFREHGYLAVRNAVPQADLDELDRYCDLIMNDKQKYANDWAWDEKEPLKDRSFRIVQSSPSFVWKAIADAPYRKWLGSFGTVTSFSSFGSVIRTVRDKF
jgi:hypothetical protein